MRGKEQMRGMSGIFYRITPAYAGKRHSFGCRFSEGWDHPRLCGEKTAGVPITSSVSGSPPPMRGKGTGGVAMFVNKGITPAYAGKSSHRRDL